MATGRSWRDPGGTRLRNVEVRREAGCDLVMGRYVAERYQSRSRTPISSPTSDRRVSLPRRGIGGPKTNLFGKFPSSARRDDRNKDAFPEFPRYWPGGQAVSAWFSEAPPRLLEETVTIAIDFLDRAGEIDDPGEARQFLVTKVRFMIAQGQRNRLLLANRAIAAYQRYRKARIVEASLAS